MGLRGPGAKPKPIPAAARARQRKAARGWTDAKASRAERVIRFIESLTITAGALAGQPFTLRPWQQAIVRNWYTTDRKGRRAVRTGLLTLARKNGKTSLCAALALAHLVGPEVERRGQVVAAASDRDQAGLIFDELVAFIQDNAVFTDRTNIQRHAKVIEDLRSGTVFRVLSSDAAKAHGLSPSVVIVDELAQWGSAPAGRRLYEALATATGARAEPLTLVISTQSPEEHNLMTELVTYGEEVRAGRVKDPTFSPFIYTVPMDADPWDETTWPLANPALGDFRSLDEMRAFAARARRMPSLAAMFRAYYLNQRVDASTPWIPVAEWDACHASGWRAPAKGQRVYLGIDLASRSDLTALALWAPEDDGTFSLSVECWVPELTLEERAKSARVPYPQWRDEGWLKSTPGNSTDYGFIERRVHELMREYQVVRVAVDPWNARDLTTRMDADGVPVVEVEQTMRSLSAAAKAFEKLILEARLRHDGSPVMRWMIGNAVVIIDANENIRPDKKLSREKIDGVSAAVTGLTQALIPEPVSVYESRGLRQLG